MNSKKNEGWCEIWLKMRQLDQMSRHESLLCLKNSNSFSKLNSVLNHHFISLK